MFTNSRKYGRRGVILLLSMCVLMLLLLVALTLVMSAGSFKQAARQFGQVETAGDKPQEQLDGALLQLLRDTTNRRSALFRQSLLEDMYGSDFQTTAKIPASAPGAPPTLPVISGNNATMTLTTVGGTTPGAISFNEGAYVGGTLRVLTGGAAGSAGVIIKHTKSAINNSIEVVVTFAGIKGTFAFNDQVSITGVPIRGTIPAQTEINTAFAQPVERLASGQIIRIILGRFTPSISPGLPSTARGNFNGCVLTMLDGPAKGCSTRIVDSNTNTLSGGDVLVLPFESDTGAAPTPSAGDSWVINGRQFSGTGNGYSPETGIVDAVWNYGPFTDAAGTTNKYWQIPYALLPNLACFEVQKYESGAGVPPPPVTNPYVTPGGTGGQNEDYDAADFQNMFLAMVPPSAGIAIPASAPWLNDIIPSFHRPALVNYLCAQATTAQNLPGANKWNRLPLQVWRKAMMRPVGAMAVKEGAATILPILDVDHPNFTGSNLAGYFDPISGPWDVDNDGDGVADSVWLDLGASPTTGPDGKLYKPLFAILCLDMDGRANLNAHGTLSQVASTYSSTVTSTNTSFAGGAGVPATAPLPLGLGVGPAEINLSKAFVGLPAPAGGSTGNVVPDTWARAITGQLMQGRQWTYSDPSGTIATFSATFEGRYGETAASAQPSFTAQLPGKSTGLNATNWANIKVLTPKLTTGYPTDYWGATSATNPMTYGSPPDLEGLGAVGVDFRGQPLFFNMGQPDANIPLVNGAAPIPIPGSLGLASKSIVGVLTTRPSSAYFVDLSRNAARSMLNSGTTGDNPFSPGELERVLRMFDNDVNQLPPRLVVDATMPVNATIVPAATVPLSIFSPYPRVTNVIAAGNITAPGGITLAAMGDSRLLFTTDSFHVPATSLLTTPDLRAAAGTAALPDRRVQSIVDVLRSRLEAGVPPSVFPLNTHNTTVISQMNKMLPTRELLAGLPLDLNRPIGNSKDDATTNNVVDEPGERTSDVNLVNDDPVASTAAFIASVDPLKNGDPLMARQIQARYLYTLLMLLSDQGFVHPVATQELVGLITSAQQTAFRKELSARRLAQWAINAVSFRESTSIMVPFEYDVNPFNGWDVDGDIGPSSTDNAHPDRRVVWSCRYPELMLTETLAFHDRRVKDTNFDDSTRDAAHKKRGIDATFDPTLDQARIPQGSLFVELYCPRTAPVAGSVYSGVNPNNALPRELYDASGNLDLGRVSPAASDATQYPVWRLAITDTPKLQPVITGTTVRANDIQARLAAYPDRTSLQPEAMLGMQAMSLLDPDTATRTAIFGAGGTDPMATPATIERIVWFSNTAPSTTAADRDKIFWRREGATSLPPGRYAVVGPRRYTFLGSTVAGPAYTASGQGIILDAGNTDPTQRVRFTATGTTPLGATSIQAAQPIVVAADPPGTRVAAPTAWVETNHTNTTTGGVGINISEPLPRPFSTPTNYYPEPHSTPLNFPLPAGTPTPMDTYGDPSDLAHPTCLDTPLDSDAAATPPRPLFVSGAFATGTYANYRTIFLQRLANPLKPYQPSTGAADYNPYVTVDWMPVDLTVFNGEDQDPGTPIPWDPDEASPPSTGVRFTTRQRGSSSASPDRLWAPQSVDPTTLAVTGTNTLNFFPSQLVHSLGWLNTTFGAPRTTPAGSTYVGDPATPFPWLVFNNRPYITPLELLLVPACSQGRLMYEFSTRATTINPYLQADTSFHAPFGHLLNFFQSSDATGASVPEGNFYRLLEYVRVPSKFAGTETVLSTSGTGAPFAAATATAADKSNEALHFPFNTVSRFRDPGLVNINTITDYFVPGVPFPPVAAYWRSPVWDAITNTTTTPTVAPTPSWNTVAVSRRGYAAATANNSGRIAEINDAYPTNFAGVFRSATGADQVPLPNNLVGATPTPGLRRAGVDAGLLRRDPLAPVVQPLFFGASAQPYKDTDRNAYFALQNMMRLPNLVTTRSNVYAVWVTVGYFELEPNPNGIDIGHPDGYRLGQERGNATGDVVRHRAFYMIDRSIPVGYERGQNDNVQRAIMIRRLIE